MRSFRTEHVETMSAGFYSRFEVADRPRQPTEQTRLPSAPSG